MSCCMRKYFLLPLFNFRCIYLKHKHQLWENSLPCFSSAVSRSSFAQTTWCPAGAKWIYDNYWGGEEYLSGTIERLRYTYEKDTTWHSQPCKKLIGFASTKYSNSTAIGTYTIESLYTIWTKWYCLLLLRWIRWWVHRCLHWKIWTYLFFQCSSRRYP